MIRILLVAITALVVMPAMACLPGQQHVHGVCRPVGAALASAAPSGDPMAPIAPALSAPIVGAGTRMLAPGALLRNASYNGVGIISRARGVDAGVTIADVRSSGATSLIRSYLWTDALPRLTVARVDMADNGAGGILLRNASSGSISDVRIAATRPETDCSKVPEGIALAGKGPADTGGPFAITRAHVEGIRSVGCSFLNGDGFSVERGYHDVLISYAYAGHNSDAGFDVKSPTVRLDHTVSEGNRRGYKMWADQVHGTVTCLNNGVPGSGAAACIQVQGARTIHIAKLVDHSTNGEPVIEVENAAPGKADITIDACELDAGMRLIVGAGVVHRGPAANRPEKSGSLTQGQRFASASRTVRALSGT